MKGKHSFSEHCQDGYSLHDNEVSYQNYKCYKLHTLEKNFTDAESECNKLPGGHLASFQTQAQRDFLFSIVTKIG